jgi:hypothetical protein
MSGYDQFKTAPTSDALAQLNRLAAELNAAEVEAEKAKESLAKANEVVTDLAERQIPELMDQLGLAEYRTTEGFRIKIAKTIRASIPAAQKDAAMDWLDEHGHGGLVKRTVLVSFSREEEVKAAKLVTELGKKFENVATDRKVEPSTLRAFIAEQLSGGEAIPLPLFGAWEQRIAKITTK